MTPAYCSGKYITYTRSLDVRYLQIRYARRQPVARPLQPFVAAKICEQAYITDRWIDRDRITVNNDRLAVPVSIYRECDTISA